MTFLGVSNLELRDCSIEDLVALGIQFGSWPPSARLSILQVTTIDSFELFVRAEGVDADTDLEALVKSMMGDGEDWTLPHQTQGGLALPNGWSFAEVADAPTWWDPPTGSGRQVVAFEPKEWVDCYYPRGNGVVTVQVGDRVYLHSFSIQHFFPFGGCGA